MGLCQVFKAANYLNLFCSNPSRRLLSQWYSPVVFIACGISLSESPHARAQPKQPVLSQPARGCAIGSALSKALSDRLNTLEQTIRTAGTPHSFNSARSVHVLFGPIARSPAGILAQRPPGAQPTTAPGRKTMPRLVGKRLTVSARLDTRIHYGRGLSSFSRSVPNGQKSIAQPRKQPRKLHRPAFQPNLLFPGSRPFPSSSLFFQPLTDSMHLSTREQDTSCAERSLGTSNSPGQTSLRSCWIFG